MFIVCFIHSFWTCGNQNQQCNYTFCCLCGTGSGWMFWWGQQFSCKVSINLLALLDWCFSPVDKSPPCKSSFPASLLFTARMGRDLSPKCFCSPVTLSNHYLSTGEGFYILAPPLTLVSAITSTAAVFCLPSRSSACSTFWSHLPSIIALGMMRNIRRGLVTCTAARGQLLLWAWLSRTYWFCFWPVRNSGSVIKNCACTAVCFGYIITAQRSGCKFKLCSEMEHVS